MFWALLRKEWRLQRETLYVMGFLSGLFLLAHLATFFVNPQASTPNWATITVTAIKVISIAMLMVLIPLMAGTSVVAHERKEGILDWQLSLPASRAKQWIAKLIPALAITLFSAGVLATLFAMATISAFESPAEKQNVATMLSLRGYWVGIFSVLMLAAAFYASAFVSEPYRALFCGILLFTGAMTSHFVINDYGLLAPMFDDYRYRLVRLPWLHLGRWLLLAAAFCLFSYLNFRVERTSLRRMMSQLVALFALAVFSGYAVLHYELLPVSGFPKTLQVASKGVTMVTFHGYGRGSVLYEKPGGAPGVYLTSVPTATRLSDANNFGRITELNVLSGKRRTVGTLLGESVGYSDDTGAVQVRSADGEFYDVGIFPLPLRRGSWIHTFVSGFNGPVISKPATIAPVTRSFTGKLPAWSSGTYNLVTTPRGNAAHLLYASYAGTPQKEIERSLMDFGDGNSPPRHLEFTTTSMFLFPYAASPNHEWYADLKPSTSTLVISKSDQTTTHVLSAGDGVLMIPENHSAIVTPSTLLLQGGPSRTLPVSPDGSLLLFCRVSLPAPTKPVPPVWPLIDGQVRYVTHALDLKSGKEIAFDRALETRFGNAFTDNPSEDTERRDFIVSQAIRALWLSDQQVAVSVGGRLALFDISRGTTVSATCTHDVPLLEFTRQDRALRFNHPFNIDKIDDNTLLMSYVGVLLRVVIDDLPRVGS